MPSLQPRSEAWFSVTDVMQDISIHQMHNYNLISNVIFCFLAAGVLAATCDACAYFEVILHHLPGHLLADPNISAGHDHPGSS